MIIPAKLKAGDMIRVVAPSRSLALFPQHQRDISNQRISDLGLNVSFGNNVFERDEFDSSSITSRVQDIHDAFLDPAVNAIVSVIGGTNVNSILHQLDFDLIASHPKIICGYSDITALANAIYARTKMITYSGPHYTTLSMLKNLKFTLDHFKACLFFDQPFELKASSHWSEDAWWADQESRNPIPNKGFEVISEGQAEGTLLGGNLGTFLMLHGTPFMPDLHDSILFFEDTEESYIQRVDRHLQAVLSQPGGVDIRGIVFGRFQKGSKINSDLLRLMVSKRPNLQRIPIMYGVDFGHTTPHITFPIGGKVSMCASRDSLSIKIVDH